MTEITVVIPNYNGLRFLEECLQALYAQTPDTPEYEVVLVDNGSSDGSVEFVRENYPEVRIEALSENTGFSYAVNVGIEKAASEYVILLNNDTKVKSEFIKYLYEAMGARPQAFSVSAKMLMWDKPELIDDAGDRYCVFGWAFSRGKGKPSELYHTPCEVFSACAGAAIYRRSVFDKIGLFDVEHFAYMEDIDVGYRARIFGYRNYYEPRAEVIHYGSASSGSRYNEWKASLASANNVYVVWKNMPLLQWIINLPFLLVGFFAKFLFFCKKGMGRIYLRGLAKGFSRAFTPAGRKHKVRFQLRNLGHYFAIQWQLYLNVFRFLKKS